MEKELDMETLRIKRLLIISLLIVSTATLQAEEALIKASDTTQLILLGTGNPNPLPSTSGPATLIIVNDTPYLFDAGEGRGQSLATAALTRGLPCRNAIILSTAASFVATTASGV